MALPEQRIRDFTVAFKKGSLEVESDRFFGLTEEGEDAVVVRLSNEMLTAQFEIMPTKCDSRIQTLLVRAPDLEYRRLLRDAIGKNAITLQYLRFKD